MNNRQTRAAVGGKDGKDKSTLVPPLGVGGENHNKKRSREDLDHMEDSVESFDDLLIRMKQLIADGNAKIEEKIDSNNAALVNEISSLREEVHQLKADCYLDFGKLSEMQVKTDTAVRKNKDAVNRLAKSNDLILSGIPYNPTESTNVIVETISAALGYCEPNYPLVFSKRLARAPIAVGSTPPVLLQFAFKACRDDFFFRYLSKKNLNLGLLGFGVDKRVYLNENLTESARSIKGVALKLKSGGRIQNVFSKDGTIFVKPLGDDAAVPVFDVEDLTKYGSSRK